MMDELKLTAHSDKMLHKHCALLSVISQTHHHIDHAWERESLESSSGQQEQALAHF